MPMSGNQVVCMTDSSRDNMVKWARDNGLDYSVEPDVSPNGVDYIVTLPRETDVDNYFRHLQAQLAGDEELIFQLHSHAEFLFERYDDMGETVDRVFRFPLKLFGDRDLAIIEELIHQAYPTSRCQHSYDCCGCWYRHFPVKTNVAGEYVAVLDHMTRNV